MNFKKQLVTVMWIVLCLVSWAEAGPVAVVEAPEYTFESVPEGTHIDHEFIVKNTGDQELNIENVLPP